MNKKETKDTTNTPILSYYEKRMQEIGVTAERNAVKVFDTDHPVPIHSFFFQESKKPEGIKIKYFTPGGKICKYEKDKTKLADFYRVRLAVPQGDAKYIQPPKSGIKPFITPGIMAKTKEKKDIETLIIVEGEFKAFSGDMAGLDIVGIGGIHNFKEKDKSSLHPYLIEIITNRKVKNVVLLFDADCISENYVRENIDKDLHTRLYSFYNAVKSFRECSKYLNVDVYFSQIKSEFETKAKGLDDLLNTFSSKKNQIVTDILKLQKSNEYFITFNVTDNSLNKLYEYFLLKVDNKEGPKAFYEKFETIIADREFIFNRLTYQKEKDKLTIRKHPDSSLYIRVKTDYYLKGHTLTSRGEKIEELLFWKIGTIRQDYCHIPGFINMISKYMNFVSVPDNTENYKQVIESCYNLYQKMKYTPKQGEIKSTLQFIKHIFQDKIDIGLDYLTILYRHPTQQLPVLCLVSKDNNTGKSTFLKWLNEIFGNNSIILGNKDFESNFNSHWASKLIVGIDESFIEKNVIKEKIKHQSTEDNINLEAKGRDIVKISWIGKFILVSNLENNFMPATKEDQRFFVLKVPVIPESEYHVDFFQNLKAEIPAFLHFLKNREIQYAKSGRMWFNAKDYETEAFKRTVRNSRHIVERAMIEYFSEIFDTSEQTNEIKVIPTLIADKVKDEIKFYKGNIKSEIVRIFQDEWSLKPLEKSGRFDFISINPYDTQYYIQTTECVGRYYTISRELINNLKNS